MKQFCIFTPSYNRAYTLSRLFQSLEKQTCSNFVWHITDDGSTDNTVELVEEFINKGTVDIRFDRCENGGKTRAVVRAAAHSKEELFLVADSDDWFSEDAIEVLSDEWKLCREDSNIAGMICLRGYDVSTPIGTWMPNDVNRTDAWSLYHRYHFKGDCLHVYRTSIFNKYPAPVAQSEKFMSEGWTIFNIAQHYQVKLINKILYMGGYLDDGLSKSVRKLTKDNPIAYMKFKRLEYSLSSNLLDKVFNLTLYLVGAKLSGEDHPVSNSPNPKLAFFCYPLAGILLLTEFK